MLQILFQLFYVYDIVQFTYSTLSIFISLHFVYHLEKHHFSICREEKTTSAYVFTVSFKYTEPVFLNVYGAPESIPRNEFRQPM